MIGNTGAAYQGGADDRTWVKHRRVITLRETTKGQIINQDKNLRGN